MTVATFPVLECRETATATALPKMHYGIERGEIDGRPVFTWYVERGQWRVSGWCGTHARAQANVDRCKKILDHRFKAHERAFSI